MKNINEGIRMINVYGRVLCGAVTLDEPIELLRDGGIVLGVVRCHSAVMNVCDVL